MLNLLNELCSINGVSGDENNVREYIIDKIKDYCTYRIDNLGNLICFKKGKITPQKKIMISAHMDEVGFIITSIRSDGTLTFDCVGGIDASVVIGRQVKVGKQNICGVIGSTAIHNLSKEDREKAPSVSSLYIDIGAADKNEAEQYVSIGDCAYFYSEFIQFGQNYIKSKAIDDRAGCAMMINLIREELEYDAWFVFNVQEEIGLRGAAVSAYSVQPDIAFVLEATTAADIDGISDAKKVCSLCNGPVISFMDRSTIYDKHLYKLAFDTASELDIKCQTKTMIAGGNDSGAIHISRNGVKTLAVSVPCRYLHSPSCVINYSDLEASYSLVKKLIEKVAVT